MPRNYVDNAMNRSLGRVGMPLGSAVQSKSSGYGGGASYSSASYCSPASSSRTYVDNSMNRSLGRVGLPVGSAVHSKAASPSPPSASYSSASYCSPASSSRTYVDNSTNRSLGRVGLPVGSAVHSKAASPSPPSASYSSASYCSPASSSRTYVDNSMNRSLGRVGLPVGSAVQSKAASPSPPSASVSQKGHEWNPLQRREAVMKKTESDSCLKGKVYKDNDFNRKHNRVGLPLGSKPIKRRASVYADNPINRHLNRVGMPMGSQAVSKNHLTALRNLLSKQEHYVEEDSGFDESVITLACGPECDEDDFNHVMENLNRDRLDDLWMELNDKSLQSASQPANPSSGLAEMQGKPIKFEDLELHDKIGHGGFGEVHLATFGKQVVAVKILIQSNLTKNRLKLFEEEITIHSQLDHPNIVKFYGPCLERPNLAIVMEYMDASLWDSIHINKVSFMPSQKLCILRDITSGLEYLHNKPLVHGDLKTQNVLLINVPDSRDYHEDRPTIAKLSDFGLSLLKSDTETSESSLVLKKLPLGATMRFSAPEVLRGEELDMEDMLKTDIYSMGLLIIDLAVEDIPFENLNLQQLMRQVGQLGKKPVTPPGLNTDLEDILRKCCDFNPRQRPSARQLKRMASRVHTIYEEEE